MLKKSITFLDFNGETQTEDFYFNLTKAEVVEVNVRADLEMIGKSKDSNAIMDAFRRIIKAAYGTRSADGKYFLKREDDYLNFISGDAYSELFMELISDASYAAEFMKAIMPADMSNPLTGASSSEVARAASEANMQGFKKPAEKPAPETPPVIPQQQFQAPIVPTTPQFSDEELAKFEAFKKAQAEEQNNQ